MLYKEKKEAFQETATQTSLEVRSKILCQARPVATCWSFAGALPFIQTKILKRLAHYLGLGQGFCKK
jgi:hypothetical protein